MDILELFHGQNHVIKYQAGDLIFEDGDIGENMYVVVEGEVEIFIADKLMSSITIGDIFGEMALIETKPRCATAVAKTPCALVWVDRKRFAELVQQMPMFSVFVMRVLAERLRKMNDYLR